MECLKIKEHRCVPYTPYSSSMMKVPIALCRATPLGSAEPGEPPAAESGVDMTVSLERRGRGTFSSVVDRGSHRVDILTWDGHV